MTWYSLIQNPMSYIYAKKTYVQVKEFDDLIYINNHNKRMVFLTRNLSDRGIGFASLIRKRLIANIDLSQSHEKICESINRINEVNWMRKEPILIRNYVIENLLKQAEDETPTKEIHLEELRWLDFIRDHKLDLYYNVSDFIHPRGVTVDWDSNSEASFQSSSTSLNPIETQSYIPLHPSYIDLRFLCHRWNLYTKLHFYNRENVNKYLFRDPENNEIRVSLHNEAVDILQKYLDDCMYNYRKSMADVDPTTPMHRLQSKTTMIYHKTSNGEYIMIYGNILALVQLGLGEPSLLCGTLYDSVVFHHNLIHDDIFHFFVNGLPFRSVFSVEDFYYYIENLHNDQFKSAINKVKYIPWFTEQPPCIYNDVAYPIMDAAQHNTEFHPNAHFPSPPDMNQHHPDFHHDIQWGKVALGLGMIAVGICCVASGKGNIPDFSSIFRGGGG